jgi:hypothetical protein
MIFCFHLLDHNGMNVMSLAVIQNYICLSQIQSCSQSHTIFQLDRDSESQQPEPLAWATVCELTASSGQMRPHLLFLPPELLLEIVFKVYCSISLTASSYDGIGIQCSKADCYQLRLTSKALQEYANPTVFRRLGFFLGRLERRGPNVNDGHTVTMSSACRAPEFTKELFIDTQQDLPYSRHYVDLMKSLPTVVSSIKEVTFVSCVLDLCSSVLKRWNPTPLTHRWKLSNENPMWFIKSLRQAIASLPRLIEYEIDMRSLPSEIHFPSGLSILRISCSEYNQSLCFCVFCCHFK